MASNLVSVFPRGSGRYPARTGVPRRDGGVTHARRFLLLAIVCLAGLASPASGSDESDKAARAIETAGARDSRARAKHDGSGHSVSLAGHAVYKRSAPAVVGITCRKDNEEGFFFGTGAIINSGGLILTSTTVVPPGAERLRVYVRGGRRLPARLLYTDTKTELALLRVEPRRLKARGGTITVLPLGISGSIRPGQTVYALGNAFQSIHDDDQVTVSEGVVSDIFHLKERRSESTYLGPAIGTSALVNGGMDGGPLVDTSGRLIGMLSLNYSRYNWLGTAIPIDVLRTVLKKHHDSFSDHEPGAPVFLGLYLESFPETGLSSPWAIRVLDIAKDSPAGEAGIRVGDKISELEGKPLRNLDELRQGLRGRRPGDKLTLKVSSAAGPTREVMLSLWGKL